MNKYEYKIDSYGTKSWLLNGCLHRENGPAIEFSNGDKHWFLNGKCHREDGPAIECRDGTRFWYLNDVYQHGFNVANINKCKQDCCKENK